MNLDELLEKFFSSFAINAGISLSDDAKFERNRTIVGPVGADAAAGRQD